MTLNRAGNKRLKTVAATLATLVASAAIISTAGPAAAGVYTEDNPPKTTITAKPSKKTTSKKATFKFVSSMNATTFQCKLDKAAWKSCKSPLKLKNLKSGKHTLKIKGKRLGVSESSPVSYTWTVKK